MNILFKAKKSLIGAVASLVLVLSPGGAVLAQSNYSCGTYGASSYSNNDCRGDRPTGWLSETGQDMLPYALGGLVSIAGGVGLFMLSRKNRKK